MRSCSEAPRACTACPPPADSRHRSRTPTPRAKETAHGWPVILPDGERIVFVISRATIPEISVTTMSGGAPRALVRGTHPRVAANGDLLFTRGSTVWGARVDPELHAHRPRTRSGARGCQRVAVRIHGVRHLRERHPRLSAAAGAVASVVMGERDGRTSPATTERFDGIYHGPPALIPDGRRLAIARHPTNGLDQIAIYDLAARHPDEPHGRLGHQPLAGVDAGRRAVSRSRRSARGRGICSKCRRTAQGRRSRCSLRQTINGRGRGRPMDRRSDTSQRQRRRVRHVVSSARRQRRTSCRATAGSPAGSGHRRSVSSRPSGKWVAYQSDESGRMEIYIRPFSGGRARPGIDERRPLSRLEPGRQRRFFISAARIV